MGTGGRVALQQGDGGRRRRKMHGGEDDDDDDEEYVVDEDEEEVEEDEEYAAAAYSDGEEDEPEPEPEPEPVDDSDADFDGKEEELEYQEEDEELDLELETPRSKRPAKARGRGRKRRREMESEDESDADFDEEELEGQDEEELEIDTPPPKRPAKVHGRGRKRNPEDESDADFNAEAEEFGDQEEDDELETPRPKRPAKVRGRGPKGKTEDDESDADFTGEEEELEDQEEDDELEIETPRPKRPAKFRGRGRKQKPVGSSQWRHEDDDDYEEEIEEEDEDFDPDVDEEEGDEEEEVEEEDDDLGDYPSIRPKNVRRQHGKRRRKSRSKVSKGKAEKGTSSRSRGKQWAADDYEDDDEDFVVDDEPEEVNYGQRKKAKVGRKTRGVRIEPVGEEEAWPLIESDTSEFEFVTSDEEPVEDEAPTPKPTRSKGKKGRRKRGSGSDSSSDSDYVISEEELKDLGVPRHPETAPQTPPPPARAIVPRRAEEKGKELEEALKQICGICLSDEQRATIQGVLNCCSHYFCFACILEWSKVESRCPLCKRRFNTITKSSVVDLGLGLKNAAIGVEKRDQVYQPTEEEMRGWLDPYENVVCIECNQGGEDNLMLLCDICDSSAHTYCVGLGREVPEGNWYCGGCRSGLEGPSNAQTQDRVVYRRESNANTAVTSSGSFGTTMSSGVFQRPPPINVQPPPQEFDLNFSPREIPEEDKRTESHMSAEHVSTPTGRHATLGRRRALNRRIRILLFRPRTATNVWQNGVQHDRTIPGPQQNQRSTCTSTELSPSSSRADFMHSQQSSSPSVQSASNLTQCIYGSGSNFRQVDNAKDQLIPIVKKNIKRIYAQSPLDQSAFTNVARRATHTILALSGIAHNRDRVVSTPFPFPSNCCHSCDGHEPAFLMRTICSPCFNSFVCDVVSYITKMS